MRRILVIDDNDSIRRMIVRCLEKQGIGALQAASTQQAQMALGQGGIDAIILDIVLGTENGWEILRHLRESSDVPVLMISGAQVDDETRLDAKHLGAQGVLPKPFTCSQLMESLSGLLKAEP